MKSISCFFAMILLIVSLKAQSDSSRVFRNLQMALSKPDEVIVLDLSKQKLDQVPLEIFQFKNLKELYLGKNKIKEIPKEIGQLKQLEIVDFSKNKLSSIPSELFDCVNLKRIILNQNEIQGIPKEIGKLNKLEYLDMWSNDLYEIPVEISNCKALKEFDLRVIEMTKAEQERLVGLLPETKIHFSAYCNCNR